MRAAALAGDRVDRLDAVRTHLVEALGRHRDDLVLAHAGLERFEDVLIDAVAHRRRHVEERDLVVALDLARIEHHLLPVADFDPELLQREQQRRLDDVDAERHVGDAFLHEHVLHLLRHLLEEADARRHRAAEARQSGKAVVFRKPRRIDLVVPRGGAEIPHPRLAVAGQQAPARELVARPLADHRARDVADVVLIEAEERAESRGCERVAGAREAVVVQPAEIDALFEIHLHAAGRLQRTLPAMTRISGVIQDIGRL